MVVSDGDPIEFGQPMMTLTAGIHLEADYFDEDKDFDIVKSPMLGVIKMIGDNKGMSVSVGDIVTKGQNILIIEVMKNNFYITAPKRGILKFLFVEDGDLVDIGRDLFMIN